MDQFSSLSDDVSELGDHMRAAPNGGDCRKERSKIGEKHHHTIDEVNDLLKVYLRKATDEAEYDQLRRSIGSFL